MKDFFGYGRERDKSGAVVKRFLNPYVNCLHTQVGHARENMEILVAEFDVMYKRTEEALKNNPPSGDCQMFKAQFGIAKYSDLAFAIPTRIDGSGTYGIIETIEPIGCAMRGRNPENPSERGPSNGKYKQRIEMGSNISNTITSVQKDSLVAEPNRDTDGCIQVGNIYPDLENMPNRSGGRVYSKEGCSPTILSRDFKTPKLVAEPIIIDDYNQRVPQDQDVICTVTTQFGNPAPRHGYKITEPLRIPQATKQGYIEVPQGAVFDMSYPESTTRRGRVQEGRQVSPTLMAGGEAPCHYEGKESTSYRIRKLTPRECFRLMGVTETDIDKIQQSGVSQSQQYKMAGNSIVVDCLYHLFRKMFTETNNENQQLSLF